MSIEWVEAALANEQQHNLAMFSAGAALTASELAAAIGQLTGRTRLFAVTEQALQPEKKRGSRGPAPLPVLRLGFDAAGFLETPLSFKTTLKRISSWAKSVAPEVPDETRVLAIDMSWVLATNSATANFETWMEIAETLAEDLAYPVISIYNRRLMIDEQMLTALRGHPRILTPNGIFPNPHALPARLLTRGTLRQQVDHWLNGISPEFAAPSEGSEIHAAEGADPMWLLRKTAEEPAIAGFEARDRWKIRCLGRLRVYRNDGSQIIWDAPGGATRKTKALFAYLLQKGGEGASADELADFLWPEADSAEGARNRLYHTVRYLRAALGEGGDKRRSAYLIRDAARYVLVPPDKSWLDISTFEQLCRQSTTHMKAAALDEAMVCLQAANRLYTGDLFADIPAEYTDDNERDWCWSKRYWLREMFFKVQQNAASIYRQRQDYSAALAHCQKALAIDPLCEMAHEEAMRVFAAQGRMEAIDRQFNLYVNSLTHFDDRPKSAGLRATYQALKTGRVA